MSRPGPRYFATGGGVTGTIPLQLRFIVPEEIENLINSFSPLEYSSSDTKIINDSPNSVLIPVRIGQRARQDSREDSAQPGLHLESSDEETGNLGKGRGEGNHPAGTGRTGGVPHGTGVQGQTACAYSPAIKVVWLLLESSPMSRGPC